MEVYITKYALTQGIKKMEVEDVGDGMVAVKTGIFYGYYHGEGREWHKTKEGAIKKAEEMRDKKIENLKKQIKKLENMKFDVIDGD